jgi:hypothetical protein
MSGPPERSREVAGRLVPTAEQRFLASLDDARIFGPFFRSPTWQAWRAFLAALTGQPMTDEQVAAYRKHTGRSAPPSSPASEAWLVIGRRGGKSFILATVAVFLATFRDWRPYLGPGERGTIMIIARDRRQARVIKRFITGLLHDVPMLRRTIEEESAERIELKNRVSIEIHTASFRSTRGYTIIAALLDEVAYWPNEDAADPDVEVINAIRPGMATIPGAMLLCASSPHARKGALWDAHRRHFGQDGDDVLVWQAATRDMNPSVPQGFIDRHVAEDPARAAAEYGAQFRVDIETFVSREVLDRAVVIGRRELPRIEGVRYIAFCDPSGGSADAMTLAICHIEGSASGASRVVLDVVREVKPPFSPDNVVREFCALVKAYGVTTVRGDRYAGEWPRERFRVHGIDYVPAAKPKSDIYRDLLPILNSGRAELLDHPRLLAQLLGLERSTARGGRDSIDHAPGAHDDVANCVAGALVTALQPAFDEAAIVIPIYGGTPRNVPGGSVLSSEVACAPAVTAPSPAPEPVSQDPLEEAKKRESAKILAEMTKPRNEPWRGFIGPSYGPSFPRTRW